MFRIIIAAIAAAALSLTACEQKEPEIVDESSTTNVAETEIYEDPNVMNSEQDEAEGDEEGAETE